MKENSMRFGRIVRLFITLVAVATHANPALTAEDSKAETGSGYDPNAMALLERVLAEHEFRPITHWGSALGHAHRYGFRKANSSELDEIERESLRLFRTLSQFRFEIVEPIERGQRIRSLRLYSSLKPRCAVFPREYWDVTRGERIAREALIAQAGPTDFIVPYAPGTPRPIDYEVYLVDGKYYAPATRNFALYRIPDQGNSDSAQSLYMLRAEDYMVPVQNSGGRRAADLPGSLSAFEHPSCHFHGSLDFRNFYFSVGSEERDFGDVTKEVTVSGDVRGEYLAEIILLDDKYYALTLSLYARQLQGAREKSDYFIFLWPLAAGVESRRAFLFTTETE